MDCSLSGSSIHGILQARILEWIAILFSGYLTDLGIEPESPALQADSSPSKPPGKLQRNVLRPLNSISKVHSHSCYNVSDLMRSNAVYNKSFCKSTDVTSDRSIVSKEGKSISRVIIYSRRNETLPFP